jgi:hypothetical protein
VSEPTRAKLFPVEGPADRGDPATAIAVQFNPTTLKVSLSNSLKANEKSENTSAAQYVDKSASSLTVELIFDTSIEDEDVRAKTRAIAEAFMKPVESGDKQLAPKRCLFQWGAFEFVGLMQSFDETLDYFSPQGTPLRATVALKLSEDRYQFRQGEAKKTERATPKLGSTGAGGVGDANKQAGRDEKAWRDTALYNGLESPRLAPGASLAVPGVSAGAAMGASAGIGASAAIAGGLSGGVSGGIGGPKADIAPPGFSYGASASLGTAIPGAFAAASVSSTRAAAASKARAAVRTSATADVRVVTSVGFE